MLVGMANKKHTYKHYCMVWQSSMLPQTPWRVGSCLPMLLLLLLLLRDITRTTNYSLSTHIFIDTQTCAHGHHIWTPSHWVHNLTLVLFCSILRHTAPSTLEKSPQDSLFGVIHAVCSLERSTQDSLLSLAQSSLSTLISGDNAIGRRHPLLLPPTSKRSRLPQPLCVQHMHIHTHTHGTQTGIDWGIYQQGRLKLWLGESSLLYSVSFSFT